jgi:hypothetical protein
MGILPVRLCGIGILPMIHGLEAHATFMGETPILLKTPYGVTLNGFLQNTNEMVICRE